MTTRNSDTPPITWDLPKHFVQASRQCRNRLRAADSTGNEITGGDALLRSRLLAANLRARLRKDGSRSTNIGILLPPSVPAMLTNLAVSMAGLTSINLNYSASESILNDCLKLAEAEYVITSRKAMERFNFKLDAQLIYLEDVRDQLTWRDKLRAFAAVKLRSASSLSNPWGAERNAQTPLTIVFTSGSTGTPKGVVLSYGNIAANVQALQAGLSLDSKDIVMGVLPFFHSFGYTVTLWAVAALPLTGVYHYNPLDAKQIGKYVKKYSANILLATPTFLRSYMRRVEPEQFESLEMVIVGAEKQPLSLSDAFETRFGKRPIEGYGMTEMSPIVSVNIPPQRARTDDPIGFLREGSVGRPLPKVEARVVSIDDAQPITDGQEGMLQVRGPSLMQGYLKRPDLTTKAIHDGWYVTGDIARIDSDGFIYLTGRLSRFSKIAGEMVPHVVVEEALLGLLGTADSDAAQPLVVTSVPDEKRGERLIVLHTQLTKSPSELVDALNQTTLPKIYLPAAGDFYEVQQIPVLGTGKLDLQGVRQAALKVTQSE